MFLKPARLWCVAVVALTAGCVEPSTRLLSNPTPLELSIIDQALAPASTQNEYAAQITAVNGTPPYRWSVVSGTLPAGLLITADGTPSTIMTGRPEEAGLYPFVLRVTDDVGAEAEASFILEVQDEFLPLSLATTELAEGVVGEPYSFDVVAANGVPPYRWTLPVGLDGLSITATGNPGVLSGTPTRVGSFPLEIEVEDAGGGRVLRLFMLTVQPERPPLRITTRSIPRGERNTPYNASVMATGGAVGNYRWTTQGNLPLGLRLIGGTPVVEITGTPEMTGVFVFELQVQDGAEADSVRLRLTIDPDTSVLSIITSDDGLIPLPGGQQDRPYTAPVAAVGGVPPYMWSVPSGRFPAGLFIVADGTPQTAISGVATESGTFSGTIMVADSVGAQDVQPFELTITPPASPLQITTSSLPSATVCESYATEVASTGGVGPFQWRLAAGTLPAEVRLQPSASTDTVTLAGTPLGGTAGNFNITLEVTDSLGATDTQVLSLTVVDSGGSIPLALLGDLEFDARIDLYLADLCAPLPAPALRVSSNTAVNRDLGTGADDLAFSPDGRKVAFIGDMDLAQSTQVYVAEINGAAIGPPIRVSGAGWTSDNDATGLKFSPDGRRLAFVADGFLNSVTEIFVVDTSGPVVADSAVVVNPQGSHPGADVNLSLNSFRFSSNSERLIFVWDGSVDGQSDAWVADVTNITARSAVRATTPVTGGDVRTTILPVPGGARFIVPGDLATDNVNELFLIDASTMPPTTVRASGPLGTGNSDVLTSLRDFGVTPDGATLWYFADNLQDGVINVLRVDLANPGTAIQLNESVLSRSVLANGDLLGTGPGLLVSGSLALLNRDELFVFDLNGPPNQPLASARVNGQLRVGADISRTAYAASPNGEWVSYAEGPTDRIMLVRMVGLQPQTAIQVSPVNPNFTNPFVSRVVFAPDSRAIAFQARFDVAGQNEAYVVPILGAFPGPWRRLTQNTVTNGDVNQLFFASPNRLVIRGDIARDRDLNVFSADISDPASTPVPVTLQFLPDQSDVSRVVIP